MASSCASSGNTARQEALSSVVQRVGQCRLCLETPKGKPLPHEPRPVLRVSATARLVVAGQAPGTRVHKSGVPFTDPSGDRLRDWMGVSLAEFYDDRRVAIIPMGFCFPGLDANGGDLPPRPECAPQWRQLIFDAMPQVELVLAIGQYAHWWHLPGPRRPVTETVQHCRDGLADIRHGQAKSASASAGAPARPRAYAMGSVPQRKPTVIALPHPSWRNNGWLKTNPWFEADLLPVLRIWVRELIA